MADAPSGGSRRTRAQRVAVAVAADIKDGRWTPGQALPSETELAREHGVGRAAVRNAIALLRVQGMVITRQGLGTFVAGEGPHEGSSSAVGAQRLVEDIRAGIASGQLKPGHQLPKDSELMDRYGLAGITIKVALRTLREEGLIYSRGREGRFVGPEDAPRRRPSWKHEQLAAALAERIRAGEFGPDEALPSEAEMQRQFGVANLTVRAAMALLREQGWAYTTPRRGTFATQPDTWPDQQSR